VSIFAFLASDKVRLLVLFFTKSEENIKCNRAKDNAGREFYTAP